ncbi:disease resistance protein [Hibiscus syriacus]|uniref:Disease resistance protein n=1 Tax=Hibiscus syriacus TaxID=106335 RepID=A0A6A3AHD8_HIBSY|nr:disease resistance protein [Hibiscus syriacus]
MASNFLKFHLQTSKNQTLFSPKNQNNHCHLYFINPNVSHKHKFPFPSIHASLVSSTTAPSSREHAILQAKTCISTCLKKPLNNPKLVGKLKKLKQPRFQVEIPLIDDSPSSLPQLALDIFKDMPLKRKGSLAEILVLWPDALNQSNRFLSPADVSVFLAPEPSQLALIKAISNSFYPKPVVIFNPKWGSEQESGFGDLKGFVGSFEVIYSFMGLEVKGVLSKRKGMVFKCVRDGVLSGEQWAVLVEEDGELNVVSRFKSRPSIEEVENVLYNLMAINSPITKSAKFLRGLVSNVTGKK